ncbi:MAG: hypothetical protein Q4C00_05670, partial [Bacillota bacterium]|nr:hypothetical protein [Bacillota bacterium]
MIKLLRKRKLRSIIAFILVFMMTFNIVPMGSFASVAGDLNTTSSEAETVDPAPTTTVTPSTPETTTTT